MISRTILVIYFNSALYLDKKTSTRNAVTLKLHSLMHVRLLKFDEHSTSFKVKVQYAIFFFFYVTIDLLNVFWGIRYIRDVCSIYI